MMPFRLSEWQALHRLLVVLTLLLTPLSALGFDESMRPLVRQLSQEGVSAYQTKDYAAAVDKLERAWNMLPTAPVGLWSARSLEKSGRLVAAAERYLEATRAPLDKRGEKSTQEKARDDAASEREQLLPRIPKLRIEVTGADPKQTTLSVAGRELPADFVGVALPVDPGQVEVKASVGDVVEVATVELAEGEEKQLTLDFGDRLASTGQAEPARSVPPKNEAEPRRDAGGKKSSWQKPVGWIGIGVGGAGLALGAVSGILLMDKYDALGCSDQMNCVTNQDDAASLNTWRTVSTVSLIAGGVLAAAGVTLLVTAPKARSGASVGAYLTPSEVGVVGRF